jgi:hypothetical protein
MCDFGSKLFAQVHSLPWPIFHLVLPCPVKRALVVARFWLLFSPPSEDHFAGGYVGVPEAVAQHLISTFTGSSSIIPDFTCIIEDSLFAQRLSQGAMAAFYSS